MKLFIEQSDSCEEAQIHIKCGMIDENLQQIINVIQMKMFSISGSRDGAVYQLSLDEIYYFESVDNKTFAYC